MAKGLITHAYLEDTADAIRVLRGESDTYTPDEFGEKIIDAIPTETASGNPIHITDAAALPAESVITTLEPVQDLHGYDKPWPAGGSKNLLLMTVDRIKAENGGASSWSGNSKTISGVTFTILVDGGNNVTGIGVNGTASENIYFYYATSVTNFVAGSYLINGGINGKLSVVLRQYASDSSVLNTWSATAADVSVNLSRQAGDSLSFYTFIASGNAFSNEVAKPMIRLASVADATFEPYSNECPISGHTGIELTRTGKNLVDAAKIEQGSFDSAGLNSPNGTRVRSSNYIRIKSGESYVLNAALTGKVAQGGISFYATDDFTTPRIYYVGWSNLPCTATAPAEAKFARILLKESTDGNVIPSDFSDVQLEQHSTATSYEPYQGEPHSITFPALGKNLLKYPYDSGIVNANGLTFTPTTDGGLKVQGTATARTDYYFANRGSDYFISMLQQNIGKSLTLHGCPSGGNESTYQIVFQINGVGDSDYGDGVTRIVPDIDITKPSQIYLIIRSGVTVDFTTYPQLELGSTATAYEPYTNTAYGCEVDWTNGVLRVDRKFVTATNNNIVNGAISAAGLNLGKIADDAKPFSNGSLSTVKSDSLPTVTADTMWNNDANSVAINNSGRVLISIAGITRFVDLQTYLSNNPIQVCYELATPLEIPLTPEIITLLKGENNVWTDAGTSEIEYKVDLQSYIQKRIDEASAQANTLSISPLSLGRSAVLTSTDGVDEPIEESEEVEKLPVEDVESVDEADEVEGEPAENKKAVEDLTVKKEIAEELAETEKVEDIKETEEQESEVEE